MTGPEHGDLAVETQDGPPHHGDAGEFGGVRDQEACAEVVRAVHDQVVAGEDLQGVVGAQPLGMAVHGDQGVEPGHGIRGGIDLGPADVGHPMDHLALQVGHGYDVVVDHADGPHPGGREVLQRGSAEPARADHQDACVLEPTLPLLAQLRQREVA